MTGIGRITLLAALLASSSPPQVTSSSEFVIGESVTFESEVLQEDRTINVYLPQSYAEDVGQVYPVIYLLDGSADEDFIHVSGIVQFGSFSWIEMLPESIVVGIANFDRRRDLTFPSNNTQDRTDSPTSGGSAKFIEMLEAELKPLVEDRFRVNATSTLIGQSLGGLLATQILFEEPELFDNYVIVSPSLWWDDESLLAAAPADLSSVNAVYVGVGEEGDVMKRVAKELHDNLRKEESLTGILTFKYFPELDHGDALHLAVYDAFDSIFATPAAD